jgi:DNA-binding HxlR family transcriptional regulator
MERVCPTIGVIEFLTRKWTIIVLRELSRKSPQRFNELSRNLRCIRPRTLSQQLRDLEKRKVIAKKVFQEKPLRVEYSLTKKGKELVDSLRCLDAWANRWA